MKRVYDVSRVIGEDMVVYKNRDAKRIKRNVMADYERNSYYESRLDLDMHTGTHVDAPLHMVKDGKTIDQIDWQKYIGPCKVFDLTHVIECVREADLIDLDIQKDDIILMKTTNSFDKEYNTGFVYLEEDAAHYLVSKQIKTLGMDAMSIERDKPGHPTHKIILGQEIGVIEDLQLKDVPEGKYFLSALPLRLQASEASPVRAVLMEI